MTTNEIGDGSGPTSRRGAVPVPIPSSGPK